MTNSECITHSSDGEFCERAPAALSPGEVVVGTLVTIDAQGVAHVNYPQCANDAGRPAITTLTVSQADVGRQVALLFANGDINQPIMIGLIYSPLYQLLDNFMLSNTSVQLSSPNDDRQVFEAATVLSGTEKSAPTGLAADSVRVDGKRIVIEGEEEVVLKCGDSSITLNQSGKIVIRGKYLLSRASGVNRILGGSVEVN